jgi:hypothetical protein
VLTIIVALPLQLFVVPETVYVAVAVGVNDAPLDIPFDQVYVVAPVAVSATVPPEQEREEDEEAITVGVALTLSVAIAVFVQPLAAVPVTV